MKIQFKILSCFVRKLAKKVNCYDNAVFKFGEIDRINENHPFGYVGVHISILFIVSFLRAKESGVGVMILPVSQWLISSFYYP